MAITFERMALYDRVWSTPLAKLAAEYGLSDNGLRKICKALTVPLPARGYWAKIAAGQEPSKARLPPDAAVTRYHSDAAGKRLALTAEDPDRDADMAWLREKESAESGLVPLAPAPVGMSPAVSQIKAAAVRAKNSAEARRRALELEEKNERHNPRGPYLGAFRWDVFAQDGYSLMTWEDGAPRISASGIDQAATILEAFCQEAARRGIRINAKPEGSWLVAHLGDERLRVSIREIFIDDTIERRHLVPKPTKKGSGKFSLLIQGLGVTQMQVGEENASLLSKLSTGDLFRKMYRRRVYARLQARQDQRRRELDRLERIAGAERARLEADAIRREAEALFRPEVLRDDVARWHEATAIALYISHIEKRLSSVWPRPVYAAPWLEWAKGFAASIDPTTERMQSFTRVGRPNPDGG